MAWADNNIDVWTLEDTDSGLSASQHVSMAHGDRVNGATWSTDGSRILSWSRDSTARVWDSANGQILQLFPHDRAVNGAVWNAAEDHVLTWERSDTAHIWGDTAD